MRRKKRVEKVRIRKSVRKFCIVILLLFIIVSLFALYDSFNAQDKKDFVKANIYEYTNEHFSDYNISILENSYISEENIGDKNIYVTDLMDAADINMTYIYRANQSSDISYNYKIIGKLEAVYKKDGEDQKVLNDTEVLVENKEFSSFSDKIEISESINLDLKERIQKIKNFQQELGLQVSATYTVSLEVTSITYVMGQEVFNVYSPSLVFDINSKTTTIKDPLEDSKKPQIVTKMVVKGDDFSHTRVIVATMTLILSVMLLMIVVLKSRNNNTVRNEYKIELNKILKGCDEKIVEVNSKIEIDGQNLIDVKEFDEIIKVSEELFKPILYWNNDKEEESWFCVIGNNMIYRFILKR